MSTSRTVGELIEDAREFLDGPVDDLVALLDGLGMLGSGEAPGPGPELAALLGGRQVARPVEGHVRRARRTRRVVAGLAAAAVAGLSVTSAAAVANELPRAMQRAVARFSEDYLPFTFPQPFSDAREVSSSRRSSTVEPDTTPEPPPPRTHRAGDDGGTDGSRQAAGTASASRSYRAVDVGASAPAAPGGAGAPAAQGAAEQGAGVDPDVDTGVSTGRGPVADPPPSPGDGKGGAGKGQRPPHEAALRTPAPPGQVDEGSPGSGPKSGSNSRPDSGGGDSYDDPTSGTPRASTRKGH